jgi:hypothetical protein
VEMSTRCQKKSTNKQDILKPTGTAIFSRPTTVGYSTQRVFSLTGMPFFHYVISYYYGTYNTNMSKSVKVKLWLFFRMYRVTFQNIFQYLCLAKFFYWRCCGPGIRWGFFYHLAPGWFFPDPIQILERFLKLSSETLVCYLYMKKKY